MKWVFPL